MSTKIDRLQDRVQQLKAENKTLVRRSGGLLRAIRDVEAEKDRDFLRARGPLALALDAWNKAERDDAAVK